jgi:hypothetical protein
MQAGSTYSDSALDCPVPGENATGLEAPSGISYARQTLSAGFFARKKPTSPFSAAAFILKVLSEALNVILAWKLLDTATQFQFEQRGKNLRRAQLRFKLFHDFIQQQRFIMAEDAKHQRLGPG